MSQAIVEIRPFQPADLEAVARIEEKVFSTPWSKESFEQFLKDPCYQLWVALVEEKIVGYCVAQLVPPEAEIHNIAVDTGYWRQGVASKMLKYFLNSMRQDNVEEVFLMLRKSNLAAQKLYQKFGFSLKGERSNYYQNPTEAAQILHKKLDTLRQDR